MRQKAKVKVGDTIFLELEPDNDPRVLPVPDSFRQALEAHPQAKAIFEQMPPSHRREILSYLNYLKTPQSLERNAEKIVKFLLKKEREAS